MINKDKVLYNGNIITLNRSIPFCEAIYIKDGIIADIGSSEYILSSYVNAPRYDLMHNTVVPAFFDAHGHFLYDAILNGMFIDVRCVPEGTLDTRESVINKLKKYSQYKKCKNAVIAFGFDDALLKTEMPSSKALDRISSTKPVIVFHISMHKLSANSTAIETAKKEYPDLISYNTGGIFEGDSILPFVKIAFSDECRKNLDECIEKCAKHYSRCGISTMCEGSSDFETADILEKFIYNRRMQNRCIICPTLNNGEVPQYKNYKTSRIICGPVKIFADGPFATYKAYLKQPYYKYANGEYANTRGCALLTQTELYRTMTKILKCGKSFVVHCNGDAALDNVLASYAQVDGALKRTSRNIVLHCRIASQKQLEEMARLNLYPSFFMPGIYLWGDLHSRLFLGSERAQNMCPLGDAIKSHLKISIHNDAPVSKVNPVMLIKSAMLRQTPSGTILGNAQRISAYEALCAVTVNAAYQYGVDDTLGSIAVNKKADLVMLNKNILETPPEKIDDTIVLGLWINGENVFTF